MRNVKNEVGERDIGGAERKKVNKKRKQRTRKKSKMKRK